MEKERLDLITRIEETAKLVSRDFLSPSGANSIIVALAIAKEFARNDENADLHYVKEKLDSLRLITGRVKAYRSFLQRSQRPCRFCGYKQP